jgi:hypothetical protein
MFRAMKPIAPICMLGLLLDATTPAAAGQVRVQPISGAINVDALAAPPGTKAIVFLFTSTDCPISNRYAPEVHRVAETFGPRGVVFRLIYPGRADTAAAIRSHMTAFSYTGIADAYRDPDLALVKFAAATVTPEAVVVVNGKVVYRGRIDDRYVDLGLERPAATTHDLADALASVLAGRPVAHAVTQAVGCFISDIAR